MVHLAPNHRHYPNRTVIRPLLAPRPPRSLSVHVRGARVNAVSMIVHGPEELLAGELITCMDDAREKWVAQPHTLLLAGFGTELELHGLAVDPYVFMVQRGDAVRMILTFVFLVA